MDMVSYFSWTYLLRSFLHLITVTKSYIAFNVQNKPLKTNQSIVIILEEKDIQEIWNVHKSAPMFLLLEVSIDTILQY